MQAIAFPLSNYLKYMFASKYRYLFILLLSGYSYLNIRFTEADSLVSPAIALSILLLIITIMVTLIWEGNHFTHGLTEKYFAHRSIYLPLIIGFAASILLVIIISSLSSWLQTFFGFDFTSRSLKLALGFTFRVNLFLNCINVIASYHSKLRDSQEVINVAKREGLNAKYDALKRQINPHFLFNSLNVLDGLIKINPEDASVFLQRLSEVYRYLTLQEDLDTIPLCKEITFIKSYVYLMEVRFKNILTINLSITLSRADEHIHIVPSALQLVLENALKHNEVSHENPLMINIFNDEQFIIISNKIQPKSSPTEKSGIGLANIRLRYEFISDTKPHFLNNGEMFVVKLPLVYIAK